ncbi:MAG TPA: IPT/TIG domain-containing protein [Candidatus Angelobacter sp.]|nr:IPT/TIG domain-containing protein [Candidatus Angelobacter sp.]
MTNRNKNLQFIYTLAIGVVLLLSASRAFATNDENHIQEIMAGANGNSKIQFIVIKQEGGGNLWGPQAGETQSRVMLQFFDAAGREIGKFKFPHNVPLDANPQLIATQDFANLTGAPAPDFIMPPLLSPIGGKVCFTNNPLNPNAFSRTDCVAYGSFPVDGTGSTGTDSGGCNGTVVAGPPTAALPIMNTVSLKRTSTTCGSVPNSDFALNSTPTPINDAGATLTIAVATQVDQGGNLFNGETFQGNGRTCGTCHIASLNLALPPSNIQSRFSTVSTTFDPLFIGETSPSSFDTGFDFNLNMLVLTDTVQSGTPCIGTLQGIITSGSGATAAKAKVLSQISPTTYLVYGGMNPALSGTVSDSNSCAGTVSSITAGSLGAIVGSSTPGLEDPKRMRTSADTVNFPQGRGLILENIDGFTSPNVFRKSPHLLNLSQRFGPFGLSGGFTDLQSFATGAVTQHFPRTLARNSSGSNPDFRLPTSDELDAMAAFMRSLDFPAGTDPNKFNLNNFVLTAAQKRGSNAFFGAAKCSFCHGSTILGSSASFNTGVVNQTINSAAVDNLPCEPASPCGSRAFVVRQLFNIANLGPFFHDGSAATLQDVLAFYNSSNFANSPGSTGFSGPINTAAISPTATDDIIAFLEGISFSPFSPTFGPAGTSVTITGFTGATAVSFNGAAAAFTVDPSGTITTTVPAGATTGRITVTTGSGPLITTTRFTVIPAITSFAPTSGPVATGVTISGTTFTGATSVSFGGTAATFTVSNSGTITTAVPFGAPTGPIIVTTLDGTATSAGNFTVTSGGPPFGLGSTPSSQTVSAGASTSYTFTISRTAGFSDNLTFTATGLPAATTATFNPNPTTGNSSTMTVTTTARGQLAPWTTLQLRPTNFSVRAWPLWVICLLVMVLLAHWERARRRIPRWVFATGAGAFVVLLCIGCGGGSSTPPPPPPGTPPGTFTITVTATSSNSSVQPVSMPVTLIVK